VRTRQRSSEVTARARVFGISFQRNMNKSIACQAAPESLPQVEFRAGTKWRPGGDGARSSRSKLTSPGAGRDNIDRIVRQRNCVTASAGFSPASEAPWARPISSLPEIGQLRCANRQQPICLADRAEAGIDVLMNLPRARPAASSELREALAACSHAFIGVGPDERPRQFLYLTGSFYMLEVYDRVLPSRSVPRWLRCRSWRSCYLPSRGARSHPLAHPCARRRDPR